MSQNIITLYLTDSRQLFISDSNGVLINPNMLYHNDFKREDKKATYDEENGKIRIEPLRSASQNSQVPYEKIESQKFIVSKKLTMDPDSLKSLVRKRRLALDESWEEYFSIGRLLTPYTTEGLEAPPAIRKEVKKRLELLAENTPKTLADLLLI